METRSRGNETTLQCQWRPTGEPYAHPHQEVKGRPLPVQRLKGVFCVDFGEGRARKRGTVECGDELIKAHFKTQPVGRRKEGEGLGRGCFSRNCACTVNQGTWSREPSPDSFTELTTETPSTGLQTHRHRTCKPSPGASGPPPPPSSEDGLPFRTGPPRARRPWARGSADPAPAAPATPRPAPAGQGHPARRLRSPRPAAGAGGEGKVLGPAGKQPTGRSLRGAQQHRPRRGVLTAEKRVPASGRAGGSSPRGH